MTDDDEQDFKQAKECHICEEKYGEKDIRVIQFVRTQSTQQGPLPYHR